MSAVRTAPAVEPWRRAQAEAFELQAVAIEGALRELEAVEELVFAHLGSTTHASACEFRNVKSTMRDAVNELRDGANEVDR